MSTNNEKSIRVIQFSGKKKDWRMWQKQFLAISSKREYKDILTGKTPVPPHNESIDISTGEGKTKMKARKANDHAYHDLILANEQPVPFNIVDKAVTADLPDGDAAKAWKDLSKKYDSKTGMTVVSLSEQYNKSKLKNTKMDPDEWIVYLEILQSRLEGMNYIISEKQLIIHILHNVPDDYDNIVEDLEKTVNDATNPLDIETVKERLHSKWERINRRKDTDDDEDETGAEALFTQKQFKGRCRICGKYGHKGADCFQNPNRKKTFKPYGQYDSGFKGKCNYCGDYGHIERYCKKKQSSNDKAAYIARKNKKNKENDEISLFAAICDSEDDDSSGFESMPDLLEYTDDEDSNDSLTRRQPWIQAELELYERYGYNVSFENEDEGEALMATQESDNNEENDESTSYDSWEERSILSDESRPF